MKLTRSERLARSVGDVSIVKGAMAERFYCGEAPRQVIFREGEERQPLDPRFDLRRHSSTGFAWGAGSTGPAQQLALALLADALQNDARALDVHQDFSRRVIPLFPGRWTITRSRVLAYVDRMEAEHDKMPSDMRRYSASLRDCHQPCLDRRSGQLAPRWKNHPLPRQSRNLSNLV